MSSITHPTFLVFGASGHIGGPAVSWLLERCPQARVRTVTSKRDRLAALAARFPAAEAIHADYMDVGSLKNAFAGVTAVLIVTPDFLDETQGMHNVVEAAAQASELQRVIRVTGDPPGLHHESEVPERLRKYNGGSAVQHTRARKVFSASEVPVVYLNICAWLMSNFATFLRKPLVERNTLVMPYDRIMNFIDTRDIGRVAAELLMDPSKTKVGETYQLHNGVDSMIKFSEIPAIFTEALGVPYGFDDSLDAFHRDLGPGLRDYYTKTEDPVAYYHDYFEWEREMTLKLIAAGPDLLNGELDLHPQKLGFAPRRLNEWIRDNRNVFVASA